MPGKYHTAALGRELRPHSPRAGADAAAPPQRNSRTTLFVSDYATNIRGFDAAIGPGLSTAGRWGANSCRTWIWRQLSGKHARPWCRSGEMHARPRNGTGTSGGAMGMDPSAQTPNPVRRWDSALLVRIGARGFEPRTSCSRSRRANRAALRPVCRRGRNVMCPPAFGRPRRGCPGPLSPQPMDVTRQQPLLIRLDPTLRARFGRDRRMPFTPRGSSRSPAGGGSTRRSRPQPRATGRTQTPSPTWVCKASWRGY